MLDTIASSASGQVIGVALETERIAEESGACYDTSHGNSAQAK